MNFVTFGLMVCILGTDGQLCSGPYPSGQLFPYDDAKVDDAGRPTQVYQECTETANRMVRELDAQLKPHGLESFILNPIKACRAPVGDGTPDSNHRINFGRGA